MWWVGKKIIGSTTGGQKQLIKMGICANRTDKMCVSVGWGQQKWTERILLGPTANRAKIITYHFQIRMFAIRAVNVQLAVGAWRQSENSPAKAFWVNEEKWEKKKSNDVRIHSHRIVVYVDWNYLLSIITVKLIITNIYGKYERFS